MPIQAEEKAKPEGKPSNVTVVTHINNASIPLSKSTNGTVLPTEKYCERYKRHYAHFCAAPKNETTHTEAKPDKFCSSFETNCIQPAVNNTADNNDHKKRADFDDNTVPLVLPPPIPFAASNNPERQENDSPILTGSAASPNSLGPVAVLPVPVAKDTNTPLNPGAGGLGGGGAPSVAIVPGGGSGGRATVVPVIPVTVTDSPALINHW
ncbi:hypothetical protein AAVH_08974 [Aphelenchoides avenae]|nr:hypothetical protein AAVH_08974 [Aphelenchus avenae]